MAASRYALKAAEDDSNPILERVKFLAISASKLDNISERYVSDRLRLDSGLSERATEKLSVRQPYDIVADILELMQAQSRCWTALLRPNWGTVGSWSTMLLISMMPA